MNVRVITHHDGPSTPTRLHAFLTREQWTILVEAFADMCVATEGAHEELHDRAAGVLEVVSLPEWVDRSLTAASPLWTRIYEHIGQLAHLAGAAPEDAAQIRAVGQQLVSLGQDMAQYKGGGSCVV